MSNCFLTLTIGIDSFIYVSFKGDFKNTKQFFILVEKSNNSLILKNNHLNIAKGLFSWVINAYLVTGAEFRPSNILLMCSMDIPESSSRPDLEQ